MFAKHFVDLLCGFKVKRKRSLNNLLYIIESLPRINPKANAHLGYTQ
jgi:hypothetical protein